MILDPPSQPHPFPPESPAFSVTPGWMITFADLLSLLLSFFVLLFATTSIDHADWRRVMQPVTVYFGAHPAPAPGFALPAPPASAAIDMTYLTAALRQLAVRDPNLAGAQITLEDDRAVMILPAAQVPCGQRRILPKSFAGIAALLGDIDNRIEVVGHSGIDPTGAGGPENWDRALSTADAVAAALTGAGVTRAIDASGQADLPGGQNACAADIVFYGDSGSTGGGGHGT